MAVTDIQLPAQAAAPVDKIEAHSTIRPLENSTPPELDGPVQPDQTRVTVADAAVPEKLEEKLEAQAEANGAPKPAEQATAEAPKVQSLTEKLAATLDFDMTSIKERYLKERDKRLRSDGNQQYKQFTGQFAHYLTDPYVPIKKREAQEIETDFLVLGGGFGGLCLAAELIKAGVKNFKIIDKAGDFGGTWYWNRYPGASCDIESYIYMPLLEETNYIPTEKYAKAPELLEHSKRIGRHFDLYSRAIFHTEVRSMKWDEETTRWIVGTDRGDTIRARFAASASGPLNMPKLPGVEGIEEFKGHSFHTSRWDYKYTGGDLYGHLDKLGDKRVGFIGTGATAVQAVPHLGAGVQKGEQGKLYVFQRTPSSIGWRDNRPTEETWAKSLKPGWQRERQENFLRVLAGAQEEDQVMDGWTSFSRWLKDQGLPKSPNMFREYGSLLELADMQNMERIRDRCDDVVENKETAAALKPWYRQFCKRPCFHDEFLDTFNLPNVELVDTDGKGIDRITEKGIVANGKEYELDCIVYGTGFEVWTSYSRRSNCEIVGRNGLSMTKKWEEGVQTLHGFWMNDFPNLFIISTTHSGKTLAPSTDYLKLISESATRQTLCMLLQDRVGTPSLINRLVANIYDLSAEHIAWIIKNCQERGITQLETTKEAEDAWTETIVSMYRFTAAFQKSCTPGYYNIEGELGDSLFYRRCASYGAGPMAFFKLLEDWRQKGDFEGLELKNGNGEVVKIKVDRDDESAEADPTGRANGLIDGANGSIEHVKTPPLAAAA